MCFALSTAEAHRLSQDPQLPFCKAALQPLFPKSHLCPVLLHSGCRIWHLFSLHFIPLTTVQCSTQSSRPFIPFKTQRHFLVWYHRQTCSRCIQLLHPDHILNTHRLPNCIWIMFNSLEIMIKQLNLSTECNGHKIYQQHSHEAWCLKMFCRHNV